MKKASELPRAVNNLRKIWEQKKAEMKFTQVKAAEELEWTQGAISHYLNGITELGPAAVIKFANFLEVDPREIDPNIVGHLPNVRTRTVTYLSSNANKVLNEPLFFDIPEGTFLIRCDPSIKKFSKGNCHEPLAFVQQRGFKGDGLIAVCPVKNKPQSTEYLVQLKNEKHFDLYFANALPPKAKIKKQLSVVSYWFGPASSRVQ